MHRYWPHRIAQTLPVRGVPLLLCVGLAGCAGGETLFFADTGKYRFHNCDQLATVEKQKVARQRELRELIDKAEQGAGGQIVSAIAYRSDYTAVNEELSVIEATVRAKNCATPASGPSSTVNR